MVYVKRFIREEEGATMVEYGLMIALIAIVCIAAITALGKALPGSFREAQRGLR